MHVAHAGTRAPSTRGRRRRLAVAMSIVAACLPVALVAPAAPVGAVTDQFTFFDSASLIHQRDRLAEPVVSSPSNWTSPTDYSAGRMFVRLEIISRPSSKQLDVQMCIWRASFVEETCSPTNRLVNTGVQWIDLGAPANWWDKNGIWTWDTPFSPARFMIKDASTGKLMMSIRCGVDCYTGTDLASHVPIRFKASSIVVAPGATLDPPTSWVGCPSTWSPNCVPAASNAAPVANAGIDTAGIVGTPVALNGSATDDGLPAGSTLTYTWSKLSGPGTVTFAPPTAAVTNATFSAAGEYIVRLVASDGALASGNTATITITDPPPPVTGTASLVTGSTVPTLADLAIQNRLVELGYGVTLVDDDASAARNFSSDDVVVISPSASPVPLQNSVVTATAPVLNLNAAAHVRMRLGSGGSEFASQTTLSVIGGHPVAGVASGNTVVSTSTRIGRAVPVAGATVVATLVNRPADVTVFAIDTGTALTTGTAAERRVGYYMSTLMPQRLTPAGWGIFDASVRWLDPPSALFDGPWEITTHSRRVPVVVDPRGIARLDGALVSMPFVGESAGEFDPATIRVVEVDPTGAAVDTTVDSQFDRSAAFDGVAVRDGILVFRLEGATTATRRFHVYYGDLGEPVTPPVPPTITLTEGVVDEGSPSLLVETPAGDWWYHTEGGGFSSLVDASGQDWIGYSETDGTSTGTFRGIPNAVYPAGYLHPGFDNSSTTVVSDGPLRVSFETVTDNGAYRVRWDISDRSARMTMLESASPYWFLYEGSPGGQMDFATDKVIRANGLTTAINKAWNGDIAGGEWAAFADTVRDRSIFVGQVIDDGVYDSYRIMREQMTVFGFGRDGKTSLLTGKREFVVGLLDQDTHAGLRPLVASERERYALAQSAPETRPAG